MMRPISIILAWLVVIAAALWLRVDDLGKRPFHFDEATGARITADRLESNRTYQFNPIHNHGPLLSAISVPVAALQGEVSWKTLTKSGLRMSTVLAGCLLVLTPLLGRRRYGDAPMLAAAAFLATSPILIYYSRTFIHEMWLTLFGLSCVILLTHKRKLWAAGLCLGAMFATKESFAISVIAWCAAGLLLAPRQLFETLRHAETLRASIKPIACGIGGAALVSVLFYSDFLRSPSSVLDAVKTFFVYQVEDGHHKPFTYYLEMLLIPSTDGITWSEWSLGVFATAGAFCSFRKSLTRRQSLEIRFFALSTLFHLLIYSLFSYKTPWLMCLPWAHACLLAGFVFCAWKPHLRKASLIWKFGLISLLIATLLLQIRTSRFATGRFANDSRNPYAYAPTHSDVESLERWLLQLEAQSTDSTFDPIAIVGTYYWPLPWYLRDFDQVGYWQDPTAVPANAPVVLTTPETDAAMCSRLKESHVSFPRTLRSNFVVMLYLRKDIWDQWINRS